MAENDTESQYHLRPLQLNDLPFIIALEQSSFPPNEAASAETVRRMNYSLNDR